LVDIPPQLRTDHGRSEMNGYKEEDE
jgi:hypothetical protein